MKHVLYGGVLAAWLLLGAGVAGAGEEVDSAADLPPQRASSRRAENAAAEPQRILVTASRIPAPVQSTPAAVSVFAEAPVSSAPPVAAEISRPAMPAYFAGAATTVASTDSAPNYAGYGGVGDGVANGDATGGAANYDGGGEAVSTGGSSLLSGVGLLETRQYRTVADALRVTPGVSISQEGGPGGMTAIRIRGAETRHSLALMDGMPINDPSTPGGEVDFADYALDNIGQLEILRGPQSVLHGSAAIGGVVSYVSARGQGPFSGSVTTEGGSRGTVWTRLKAQAGNERGDFSFGGGVTRTDGISNGSSWRGNPERDGYSRASMNLRLGVNAAENLRFDLFANASTALVELDSFGKDDAPTYNYRGRRERYMLRPQATLSLFDGRWEQKAGYGVLFLDRKYHDALDFNRARFKGETRKFDYQSLIRTHENNTIVAGVDVVSESMSTWTTWYGPGRTGKEEFGTTTMTSVYVEDQFNWRETLFLNAGLRYDHHDRFDGKTTWKAGALYVLPFGTRLKANAGTGFKAPTLDNLYRNYPDAWNFGFRANPDLKPERSFGWDVGFEHSLCDSRVTFGSSFFSNRVKDYIGYTVLDNPPPGYRYGYANLSNYRTVGVESSVRVALTDNLVVSAQHTWQSAKQSGAWDWNSESYTGQTTPARRPRHEASINADWRFLEKGTLSAGVRFKGKRKDIDRKHLPSHAVARLAASWKVNDHVEVFGRVENIFDKTYEESHGYGTEGRGFFGGATISF